MENIALRKILRLARLKLRPTQPEGFFLLLLISVADTGYVSDMSLGLPVFEPSVLCTSHNLIHF